MTEHRLPEILRGFGPPAADMGAADDLYFCEKNHLLYGPKSIAQGWGEGLPLQGPWPASPQKPNLVLIHGGHEGSGEEIGDD